MILGNKVIYNEIYGDIGDPVPEQDRVMRELDAESWAPCWHPERLPDPHMWLHSNCQPCLIALQALNATGWIVLFIPKDEDLSWAIRQTESNIIEVMREMQGDV